MTASEARVGPRATVAPREETGNTALNLRRPAIHELTAVCGSACRDVGHVVDHAAQQCLRPPRGQALPDQPLVSRSPGKRLQPLTLRLGPVVGLGVPLRHPPDVQRPAPTDRDDRLDVSVQCDRDRSLRQACRVQDRLGDVELRRVDGGQKRFPVREPAIDRAPVDARLSGDRGHGRCRVLREQPCPRAQDCVQVAGCVGSHGGGQSPTPVPTPQHCTCCSKWHINVAFMG